MDSLCQELARLTRTNKVAQPEQVIFQALVSLDSVVDTPASEEQLSTLEKAVVALCKVNDGKFSVQCSIFIADCLIKIYGKMTQPPVAVTVSNLLAQFPATAIVIGRLCETFGQKVSSMFAKIVDAALLLPESQIYEALYSLRGVCRYGCTSFGPKLPNIWKLLKKHIANPPESVQLLALKVLKNIVKSDAGSLQSVIDCSNVCAGKQQVPFVRFQISNVLAACAVRAKDPARILRRYPDLAGHAVQRYMELIGPQKVIESCNQLSEIIGQCCPEFIVELARYLPEAGKQRLFNHVLSQSQPSVAQVTMLILLANTQDNFYSAAGAALQLGRSQEGKDRDLCRFYFAKVAKKCPNTAGNYLSNAIQTLTTDKFDVYTLAYGIVAMAILESDSNYCCVLNGVMDSFVDAVSSLALNSPRFAAMLGICAYVPESALNKEKMESALVRVKREMSRVATLKDPIDGKLMITIENALLFCSAKPSFAGVDSIYDTTAAMLEKMSETALSHFIDLVIVTKKRCETIMPFLIEKSMTVFPGRPFCKNEIGRVVLTADDILQPKRETDTFVTSRQMFGQKIIRRFSDLLELCSPQFQEKTITDMLVQQTNVANRLLVSHLMILMVVRANKIALPKTFKANLLKSLRGADYLRIQISCETVALLVERNFAMLESLFRFVELNKRAVSCLLLSAMMCRIHFPNRYLSRALLYLDERLFCHYSAPFALHAISTALHTHQDDIRNLHLGGHHLSMILGLLNGATSLHPVVLYHQTAVFLDLITVADEADVIFIRSILNTIRSTPYSLAKGIYYTCVTSVAQVFQHLARNLTVNWPSRNCPSQVLIVAAEAYASIGKIPDQTVTEPLLRCLQKTQDRRIINCLCSLLARLDIQQFLVILDSVFMKNVIMNSEPCYEVRLAVMKALSNRISCVSQTNAFPVALSCCAAASSGFKELQVLAFPCLQYLIDHYNLEALTPHFSALSEVALTLDLSVTGGFLAAFMSPANIDACLSSLLSATNFTNEYLAIAARVIKTAADSGKKTQLMPFVSTILPRYQVMVKQAMESSACEENMCYKYMHAAFVVLMSLSGTKCIDPKSLFAFYAADIARRSQPWIIQGDLNGAAAVVEFFGDELEPVMVSELLDTAVSQAGARDEVVNFVAAVSKRESLTDHDWMSILYSIINIGFRADTLARSLTHFETSTIETHAEKFATAILENDTITDEQRLALFNLLGSKAEHKKGNMINCVLDWANSGENRSSLSFKVLSVITPGSESCDLDALAVFVAKRLRRGGVQFAGALLMNDPLKGIQVAVRGVASACVNLLVNDQANSQLYLGYLSLCMDKISSSKFVESVRKGFLKHVIPNEACGAIIHDAVTIVRDWKEQDPDSLRSFYDSLGESEREKCVRILMSTK